MERKCVRDAGSKGEHPDDRASGDVHGTRTRGGWYRCLVDGQKAQQRPRSHHIAPIAATAQFGRRHAGVRGDRAHIVLGLSELSPRPHPPPAGEGLADLWRLRNLMRRLKRL
jgi:hypothetical protein